MHVSVQFQRRSDFSSRHETVDSNQIKSGLLLHSAFSCAALKLLLSLSEILPLADQRTMKAHEQLWRVMQRVDQVAGGYLALDEAVHSSLSSFARDQKRQRSRK
jgi:hypothetical protein